MNVGYIFSRVRKVFPEVSLAEVVALINDALDDGDDILGAGVKTKKISAVSGKYDYPLGYDVIKIKRVFYLDADGDYRPIPKLTGDIDVGF